MSCRPTWHSVWHLVQFRELDPLLQGAAAANGRDVQHAIPELDEGSAGGDGGPGKESREPGRMRAALNSNPALPGTTVSLYFTGDKNHPLLSQGPRAGVQLCGRELALGPGPLPSTTTWEKKSQGTEYLQVLPGGPTLSLPQVPRAGAQARWTSPLLGQSE